MLLGDTTGGFERINSIKDYPLPFAQLVACASGILIPTSTELFCISATTKNFTTFLFPPVSDDSTLTWKHQKIPEDAFSVQPTSLRKRCHSYF